MFAVVDLILPDEQILNENQLDMDDFIPPENQDEEAVAMGEESPLGIWTLKNINFFYYSY